MTGSQPLGPEFTQELRALKRSSRFQVARPAIGYRHEIAALAAIPFPVVNGSPT
jgi:hypothetical protein